MHVLHNPSKTPGPQSVHSYLSVHFIRTRLLRAASANAHRLSDPPCRQLTKASGHERTVAPYGEDPRPLTTPMETFRCPSLPEPGAGSSAGRSGATGCLWARRFSSQAYLERIIWKFQSPAWWRNKAICKDQVRDQGVKSEKCLLKSQYPWKISTTW